jgi:cell division protein FtsB
MATTAAAPRRRAPARRAPAPGRIRWDRLGRYALLAVLCAILLAYISPISNWMRQSDTAERERAELHQLQAENERLENRVKDLKRPAALEREARKLGMVREGERAYVIENLGR